MRWLLILALLLLLPALADAQTCTIASCSAPTCNRNDVVNNLPNSSAPATVTLTIPAGTCTWTSGQTLNYTIPSNVTSLTIQGQTTVTGTCDGLTGGSCTATDNTTIIDHSAASSIWNITTAATQSLRITGMSFTWDAGSSATTNGAIAIGGKSSSVRRDHNHWNSTAEASAMALSIIYGAIQGVDDHSIWDMGNQSPTRGTDNGTKVYNGETAFSDTSGNGNLSWSNATSPGSNSGYFFFENDVSNHSILNDCNHGGRQVFRHITFNDSSIQTHEMDGDSRGCRATEVYQNTYNGTNGDGLQSFTVMGCRMGTCLVWGNIVNLMENLIVLSNDRSDGQHSFLQPPSGFGYCGTYNASPFNGPSNWDGNTTTAIGYPCLDQPSRGKSDVVSGTFPNKCNITTFPSGCSSFTGSYVHNLLEPVYEWLNQIQIGAGSGWVKSVYFANAQTPIFTQNKDFYQYTLSWNGSSFTGTAFNGTAGTGSGTHAARPATCTAGPGGTFGNSPTGSFGVAYWETDTTTLFVCSSTNTWTNYYTPFTYPHPLITGQAATPTFSPVGGAYVLPVTVIVSDTTTGATACYTTDNSTPTANGAGACTHGTATTFPFTLNITVTTTVKAIASISGSTDSGVGISTYTPRVATPTFSPVSGYTGPSVTVTISDATGGATICYTLDGSLPTANNAGICTHGTQSTAPASVPISTSVTINAIGSESGFTDSAVGTSVYTIIGAETPLIRMIM